MEQKQKTAILFLAMAGVLALGFGFWRLGHNIKAPFLLNSSTFRLITEDESLFDQQSKDTDRDGLSDYEETYFYGTSPYLDDSDSDGRSDRDEISLGSDPNCPEGKECTQVNSLPSLEPLEFDIPDAPGLTEPVPGTEVVQPELDLTNLTADEIRELLRSAGIDEKSLAALTDEMLIEIYREALQESQ